MADLSAITLPNGSTYDLKDSVARKHSGLFFGAVDSTSTNTVFTAQVAGITEYYDGLTVMLKNGVVTSAAGFTLNINNLGAKPSFNNMAAATQDTTIFNVNYTMMFVYDSTRTEGGGWICYRGYNSNDNTTGYILRTNGHSLPMDSVVYRYRLLFSNADCTKWVPANNSTSTNATAKRNTCQTKINPFGPIVYYATTAAIAAGNAPGVAYLYQQYYNVVLGYSFNRTGAALTMTANTPVYIKCAPQTDGTVIIDEDAPYVQSLPSAEDGKVYIYLGVAVDATHVEVRMEHPIFEYKGGFIRLWDNKYVPTYSSETAASGGTDVSLVTTGEKYIWNNKQDALTFDNSPTSGSTNPVKSGGVYTALSGKQNTLTFDTTPTSGSTNPVTSGGVYTMVQTLISEIETALAGI